MIGSTFLFSHDPTQLLRLAEDLDSIDDFVHVDMDGLVTLDFEMACGDHAPWTAAGAPVTFDEEGGLAIFRVDPAGIAYALAHRARFDEDMADDLDRFAAFVAEHGREHIYELATF